MLFGMNSKRRAASGLGRGFTFTNDCLFPGHRETASNPGEGQQRARDCLVQTFCLLYKPGLTSEVSLFLSTIPSHDRPHKHLTNADVSKINIQIDRAHHPAKQPNAQRHVRQRRHEQGQLGLVRQGARKSQGSILMAIFPLTMQQIVYLLGLLDTVKPDYKVCGHSPLGSHFR